MPSTEDNDAESANRQFSRFDLVLSRFDLQCMALFYSMLYVENSLILDSQSPDLQETQPLEELENNLAEW